jgi:hypothetical protein
MFLGHISEVISMDVWVSGVTDQVIPRHTYPTTVGYYCRYYVPCGLVPCLRILTFYLILLLWVMKPLTIRMITCRRSYCRGIRNQSKGVINLL